MSRIDELIAEHCPDGVEYRELGDVADLKRGTSITRKQLTEGTYPVIAGGRRPAYYHGDFNRHGETIVVAGSGAYAGHVSRWSEPIFVSDAFSIQTFPNLESSYLFHWLKSEQDLIHGLKSGGGVPHVYARDVAPLRVPVPPLQVQQEIVRILDTFSELEAELEVELEAEQEARRKQYRHFRRILFAPFASAHPVPLAKACYLVSGEPISRRAIEASPGPYPVMNSGVEPLGYFSSYNRVDQPLGVTSRGAGVGSITWCPGRFYQGPLNYGISPKEPENVDLRFLRHQLWCVQPRIERLCTRDGIPALNKRNLAKLGVWLPSLEKQREIADALDKFDATVNGISIELSLEIETRRKQYEHYRDKLLTFEEKK